jgi:hypothetical protein
MTTKTVHELAPGLILRDNTNECWENVWRWSGGDWRIGHAHERERKREG